MAIYRTQFSKEYHGLAYQFRVNPLKCGNHSHYEDYLKYNAITDQKIGKGKTYIIVDENELTNDKKIVGFITLRASSLVIEEDNFMLGYSAMEITELSVDIDYENQGYGRMLVDWALIIADELRNEYLGIEYITLCADPMSVSFYKHNEFFELDNYRDIPREGWSQNCIPMALKLSEY